MKNKYSDLSKNVVLFTISSFGQKILAFLLVPLYTSFLSTQEYGIIDLVSTTVNLLIPVFSLNMAEGVMRFTLEDKEKKDYLSYGIITIAKGTLLLICGLLIAYFIPALSGYRTYLPWMFAIFIMNVFYSLSQNYLRATDRVFIMVIGSLINTIVMLGLDVLFIVVMGWGFSGYYLALLVGLFMASLFMQWKTKLFSNVKFSGIKEKQLGKELLPYCIPTIFTGLAWWINSSLDKYIVTGICGVDQNGIYSVAYKIPTILGVFQTIFTQAWSISAVVEFDKDDKDGFFGNTYEMYNSGMVMITSIVMIFNMLLSRILYAKDFFETWRYVPLLLFSTLFSAMAGYLGGIFSAVKDTKTCAYSTFVSAGINIILNFILINRYGVIGAAVATAIAYFASWIIRVIVSTKYIKMKVNWYKSAIVYILLLIQTICATMENHYYVVQGIILILIFAVYLKNYLKIIKKGFEVLKRKLNREEQI